MTIINPYGIGAGKAIAEQYEEEPDKIRKESRRRENAVQLADRERLKARLQERSTEYSVSKVAGAARVAMDLGRSVNNSLKEAADGLAGILPEDERLFEARAGTKLRIDERISRIQPKPERPDQRRPELFAAGAATGVLDVLLNDIRNSAGRLSRERVLSCLDSLKESIRSRDRRELSQDDKEGVLGYLDFLDGYFEAGAKNAGQSEKMASLMAEIRVQLAVAADPAMSSLVQQLVLPGQKGDVGAGSKLTSGLTTNEARKAVRGERGRGVVDGRDESDQTDSQQAVAATAVPPPQGSNETGARGSQSSLGKDSGRRRDETIVTVTLRSV